MFYTDKADMPGDGLSVAAAGRGTVGSSREGWGDANGHSRRTALRTSAVTTEGGTTVDRPSGRSAVRSLLTQRR